MFLAKELTQMFLQYKMVCLNKRSIQNIKKVNTKHTFKCMHIANTYKKIPCGLYTELTVKKRFILKQ